MQSKLKPPIEPTKHTKPIEPFEPIKTIQPIIRLSKLRNQCNEYRNSDPLLTIDDFNDDIFNDDIFDGFDNIIHPTNTEATLPHALQMRKSVNEKRDNMGVVIFAYNFNDIEDDNDNILQLSEIDIILSKYVDKHWILQLDCIEFLFKHTYLLNGLAKLILDKYEVNLLQIDVSNATWKFQLLLSLKWWFLSEKIRGTIGQLSDYQL